MERKQLMEKVGFSLFKYESMISFSQKPIKNFVNFHFDRKVVNPGDKDSAQNSFWV